MAPTKTEESQRSIRLPDLVASALVAHLERWAEERLAATLLCAAGVPMPAISRILGHASTRTTQDVYAHVTYEVEAEMAAQIDAIFRPVDVSVAVKTALRKPH